MKSSVIKAFVAAATIAVAMPAMAQFNVGKAIGAGVKAAKAATLTDEQMAAYVKESVDWMDANNPVTPDDDPYTIRLKKLTDGLTEADGIPLNFKVYRVIDVNAFACPDGSVAKRHSKKAFRTELLTGALKDGVSAAGGVAAKLSDSQLGQLSQGLVNSKFSQKQEKEADDYGYEFLKENGKNPWGMVQAFEKFQKMEDEAGAKPTYIDRMFSSHPETVARIKRMTERCQKDGIARQESK